MASKKTAAIMIALVGMTVVGATLYTQQTGNQLEAEHYAPMPTINDNLQIDEPMIIHVSRTYTATQVDDIKMGVPLIIRGTIIGKEPSMESRNEFGGLVGSESPAAVLSTPYWVYEVRPFETFKGERKESVSVKMTGGTFGDLTVKSDDKELFVGQDVVMLLSGPYENGLYQPSAGPYSVFVVQDGRAIGMTEDLPIDDLREKLAQTRN